MKFLWCKHNWKLSKIDITKEFILFVYIQCSKCDKIKKVVFKWCEGDVIDVIKQEDVSYIEDFIGGK